MIPRIPPPSPSHSPLCSNDALLVHLHPPFSHPCTAFFRWAIVVHAMCRELEITRFDSDSCCCQNRGRCIQRPYKVTRVTRLNAHSLTSFLHTLIFLMLAAYLFLNVFNVENLFIICSLDMVKMLSFIIHYRSNIFGYIQYAMGNCCDLCTMRRDHFLCLLLRLGLCQNVECLA